MTSSVCLLPTRIRIGMAAAAPMAAPTRRCSPKSLDCSRLGFIATMVAMGIQSALGRCPPKAMAAEAARASDRINAKRTIGRVSCTGDWLPGRSMTGAGRHLPLLATHTRNVRAIHAAAPISQASAWSHALILRWPCHAWPVRARRGTRR